MSDHYLWGNAVTQSLPAMRKVITESVALHLAKNRANIVVGDDGKAWLVSVRAELIPQATKRSPAAMFVEHALIMLRIAREDLKMAGARKALARVRAAITSTEGALRHAELEPFREERKQAEREHIAKTGKRKTRKTRKVTDDDLLKKV